MCIAYGKVVGKVAILVECLTRRVGLNVEIEDSTRQFGVFRSCVASVGGSYSRDLASGTERVGILDETMVAVEVDLVGQEQCLYGFVAESSVCKFERKRRFLFCRGFECPTTAVVVRDFFSCQFG